MIRAIRGLLLFAVAGGALSLAVGGYVRVPDRNSDPGVLPTLGMVVGN